MQFSRTGAIVGLLVLTCFSLRSSGATEARLVYRLRYDLSAPSMVHVTLDLPEATEAPLTLIMPRSVPGGYVQRPYDPFVSSVKAFGANGAAAEITRDEFGPRWTIGKCCSRVNRIEYDVDVSRMEREIFAASDSSKIREGYAGLLGYSIFGFIDGWENRPIQLEVFAPPVWPIFSTLAPSVPSNSLDETSRTVAGSAPAGTPWRVEAADYYALADSQVMIGPKLVVRQLGGGVPLFLAAYSETDANLEIAGSLARDALDKVTAYFGKAPFSNYTVVLEFLKPVSPQHEYGFSMEHLNSGTFYLDVKDALTAKSTVAEKEENRLNYAHHIAHSWIPKHAYGVGYMPFNWEMTPVIDTIWFNEGFGRYAAIAALSTAPTKEEAARYRKEHLDDLRGIVAAAPKFLRRMPLDELSREGSFLYATDFRVGMNLFSRGALMAAEMDDRIRSQTAGEKSLRDALRHLMDWSERNRRAFRTEELPAIFREATGVDTTSILQRWMQPLN
jgi:predicted metalloprotease with PDZ domain